MRPMRRPSFTSAVVIRPTGDHQPVPLGERGEVGGLPVVVLRVEDLDAVQSPGDELGDFGVGELRAPRVGCDGDAASCMDGPDRFLGGDFHPLHVAASAVEDEVGVKADFTSGTIPASTIALATCGRPMFSVPPAISTTRSNETA